MGLSRGSAQAGRLARPPEVTAAYTLIGKNAAKNILTQEALARGGRTLNHSPDLAAARARRSARLKAQSHAARLATFTANNELPENYRLFVAHRRNRRSGKTWTIVELEHLRAPGRHSDALARYRVSRGKMQMKEHQDGGIARASWHDLPRAKLSHCDPIVLRFFTHFS